MRAGGAVRERAPRRVCARRRALRIRAACASRRGARSACRKSLAGREKKRSRKADDIAACARRRVVVRFPAGCERPLDDARLIPKRANVLVTFVCLVCITAVFYNRKPLFLERSGHAVRREKGEGEGDVLRYGGCTHAAAMAVPITAPATSSSRPNFTLVNKLSRGMGAERRRLPNVVVKNGPSVLSVLAASLG